MLENKLKIKAFTLAEVLITLAIIGVVAALTIPVLISNYQKAQYVSNFEKVYSTLNQAFAKYAADQGCDKDLQCTDLFSDTVENNVTKWDDFVENYLKVVKNCGTNAGQHCFPDSINYLKYPSYVFYVDNQTDYYKVILADGMSLGFTSGDAGNFNCTAYTSGYSTTNQVYGLCGFLVLDTNGLKGPNITGRDSFAGLSLGITRYHGVVPFYGSSAWGGDGNYWKTANNRWRNCDTATDSDGEGCAARIIDEGWEMKY